MDRIKMSILVALVNILVTLLAVMAYEVVASKNDRCNAIPDGREYPLEIGKPIVWCWK